MRKEEKVLVWWLPGSKEVHTKPWRFKMAKQAENKIGPKPNQNCRDGGSTK